VDVKHLNVTCTDKLNLIKLHYFGQSFLIQSMLLLMDCDTVRKITFSVLFCVVSTDLCVQVGNSVPNQNIQECLLQQYQCSVSKTFPSK